MKKLLAHIIFACAFISSAHSQCGFDNSFYTDLTPASAGATASDGCVWGGDLITVNVVMGETYIISTCASTGFTDTQITLYNAAGTVVLGYNDDFCGLWSEITYVAGYTGVLNVLLDEYNCTNNTECVQLDVTWLGGCAADVGTFTILENGLPTTSPIYLCSNATSCIDIISNDDYVLPTPVVGEVSEVMYAIFNCPPSGVAPDLDPCFTGFFWTGEDFNDCNNAASILLGAGLGPNVYFVPITMDDSDDNGNPNGAINYDNNGDGCYDMGTSYEIIYLNPITFATVENCDGTVGVTISGGMPEENASNYVITNTGSGTLIPGSVTHGGVATISGLANGQAYSLSVTDSEGCTTVYPGGTYSGALNASFNYSAAAYCVNAADPTPTITGTTGGTFTSTAGLSINSTSGQIDVSASTPGAYTVTYTTPGPCSSSNVSVTINALDNATFNYSAAAYCVNAIDPTPTISGLAGGTFSSTAGLAINPGTGTIDVSASTPGAYTVTYTTVGSCPNSSNVSVTINALDNASFNYSAAAYCVNAIDPTPTISGLAGGTFSSTAGLAINLGTGTIDVSASTPGAYTVTYTTAGACPNSSNVSVTITALDDATFNYSAAAYCVNASDPTPTISGLAGGTFSSTAGLAINPGTGTIDVSASTPGAYTVTYTTVGTCPNSSNVSVTITALDNASFSYGAAAYCVNASDPTPTISGLLGGTFSSTAGLAINPGTGTIDVSASTLGAYTVTYTTVGTCPNSSNVSVTITALDNASFSYGAGSYCLSSADPTPTISGLAGGTFSSTAGLAINPGTGTIDVSASTAGTYTVTYTTAGTCPNNSNVSVTITALDDATFNYSAAAYCVNDVDPMPTISGVAGGTFSSTVGLSLNATTGSIDVSASTPGSYTVTYSTTGICANSSNVSVTVNALDDATFSYSAASYCVNASDPTPTISGVAGGTFSSTAGLAINPGTGTIDVSASTPGTYTVTYTTVGTCPNSSNVSVTITALDDATFNYSAAAYCVSDVDPTPTISGLAGGTFSSTVGLSINATTGSIDVSASTPGVYTVTYATAGACANSSNVSVTINALDDATFSYSAASYCLSDVDPTPTISGLAGGTFSSTIGLSINATTGIIDVSASTAGTYTVTYTTAGTCPNSSNVSVTITALDDATFNYSAASYCVSDADPTPTISGLAGGTFSSTAGLAINPGTGTIDVSVSTAGTYTVTYTTAGTCPNSSNVSVTITALDDATFNYSAAAYCVNDVDPMPTISGVAGGTFSSTVGLSINATTGSIDVSASTPGVYTVTYATAGACANSSNVSVTINALDDATFSYSAASYCLSDVDPTPTISGLAGGTFSSTVGLSINATTGLIDVSASTPGVYTVTYTTAGTCPNSSNVSVTITALDDATFNYSAAAYCMNGINPTPTITGVAGGIFSSTAGLVINASTGQIDLAASTAGTYSVTYTTSGTCSNSSNVAVVINAVPTATAVNSGPICADAPSFTLDETGGNATGWIWSTTGGATITNTGDQSPTITGAVDGEVFTVTVTDINGCSNSAQTTITINALPTVTATNSGSICEGDAITLNEIGGDATSWSWATNGGATITNTGDQSPTVSGGVDGEMFTITGTDVNGCVNTSTTTIVVVPMPVLNAITNVTACDSYTLPTIGGSNLSGNEAYYDDSQSNGGSVISGPITSTQVVWVYDATGSCSDELSFTVTINSTDDPSFTFTDFCSGDPNAATITGTTGGSFDFDTNPNDGATINAATGEIASGVIGTTYTVSYTTTGACPANSIEAVTVIACEILVPTAITPSGFPNNTWEIPNLDVVYPDNTVTIYNRWGNVVFEHTSSGSNPYNANPWDGTLKGTELPVASYYYVIKFNDGSGDGVNGTVTIIRN